MSTDESPINRLSSALKFRRVWALLPHIFFVCSLLWVNGRCLWHIHDVVRVLGSYVYPLDDAYIHLAIAKNLAFHGNWGINPGEFAGASSSPLYVILVAALMRLGGDASGWPLFVNLAAANFLAFLLWRWWRHDPVPYMVALVTMIFGSLLVVQVLVGMEASLQILSVVALVQTFVRWQEKGFRGGNPGPFWWLLLATAPLIRYELLCPALLLCGCMALEGARPIDVLRCLLCLVGPVAVLGMFFWLRGGYFVPYTLLLKNRLQSFPEPLWVHISDAILYISSTPHFMYLLMGVVFAAWRSGTGHSSVQGWRRWIRQYGLAAVAVGTLLAHGTLGGRGWLFRYEAYLMAIMGMVLAAYIKRCLVAVNFPSRSTLFFILLYLAVVTHGLYRLHSNQMNILGHAHVNIFQQQIQTARLLNAYFPEKTIAVNDIGAVSYFTNCHILDLIGLGNRTVLSLRLHAPEKLEAYFTSLSYDLMAIYDRWFSDTPFQNRTLIGRFTIPHNYICGDSTVSYYAPSCDTARLRYAFNALRSFAPTLPRGVKVELDDWEISKRESK
ncbi:MAG: hypothetical protein NZM65_08745 [Flavobacteriales bacterium]|nr:hypothetical protein [Flavobacteriales bacterium]MDW8410759.1 hypothetical protein [Flavobacteriales bacterium]